MSACLEAPIALLIGAPLHADIQLRQQMKRFGIEARLASVADAHQMSRDARRFIVVLGLNEATAAEVAPLIRELRCSGVDAPIMLVCQGTVGNRVVEAIEAGASDFVRRSSAPGELRARFQLLATRAVRRPIDRCIRVADLEIDRENRVVSRDGVNVVLTNREFRVLERLMESAGEPVRREDLEHRIWGYEAKKASNIVDVYILYVRKKLSVLGYGSAVRTLRGVGYSMVVSTEEGGNGGNGHAQPSPRRVLSRS
jgi:DNA-binding response OmpR family regulator